MVFPHLEDVFQLRMVDLASILIVMDRAWLRGFGASVGMNGCFGVRWDGKE